MTRITLCAVGRMRPGPEKDLVSDYLDRFHRTGRGIGLTGGDMREVEDRKGGGQMAEAALLEKAIPEGAVRVMLDERGRELSSIQLSNKISEWRDAGRSDVVFVIGGADGLTSEFRKSDDLVLSLGAMVWPHMLVRVMISEQLYRAASILAGSPYHRA